MADEKKPEITEHKPALDRTEPLDANEIKDADLEKISGGDEADALFGKRGRVQV